MQVIGPVSVAATAKTVPAPTLSASLIPPPFLADYSWPTSRQWPQRSKNESWSFPSDIMLGVAGAAAQIEGAAKADRRGPSIVDYLGHRTSLIAGGRHRQLLLYVQARLVS